jgi:DHA2 family multidrug resistance protein
MTTPMIASQSSQPTTVLRFDMQAPYYKWLVAGTVLMAAMTQTFAGNSVNLAIPRLMSAFGTNLATAQWIATGFLITRTLVVPILGWLGGFLGNRNLFVTCLIGFVAASIGCGLASNLPMLIVFRLMQGMMVGPMEGLSAVLLVQAFPPHQRGLALGLRAMGSSVGHVVSFTLGGYFLEQMSWRLIFFLGVPTGIVAAILGLLILPQKREYQGMPIDYTGLLCLAGFLVPLLLAISFGRDGETATSTLVLLALIATAGGSLFILWELFTAFPAVNLRLFRIPAFDLVCSTAFLNNVGLFGSQFMIPIFLQQVMGFTPLQAGLVIVPAIIASGLSGVVTGRLSDILPPSLVVLGATGMLVAVFYCFSSVSTLTAVGVIVLYITGYRVCMFATNTPLTNLNARILGTERIRMGQGLMGVTRNIGAGLGVTITSVVFERRRTEHQLLAYHLYDQATPAHDTLWRDLQYTLHHAGMAGGNADQAALMSIRRQMDVEAVAAGFRDSFLFIGLCFFLSSLPMMLSFMRRDHATTSA